MTARTDNSKTLADALAELERLRRERDNDTEWLEKLHEAVVSFAGYVDERSRVFAVEWRDDQRFLKDISALMKERLDGRKRVAE